MIRKPADGWGRESAAVGAVRTVATTGKTVVQAGGRMVQGVILCGIGAIFVLSGLTSGLFGGSIPSLIGCSVVGGLLLWSGLRSLKPRPAPGASFSSPNAGAGPGFAAGSPATTVEYSRGKLLAQAGLGVVLLAIGLALVGGTGGFLLLIVVFLIPLAALMAFGSLRRAFGDLTALRWDQQSLTVTGLIKRTTVPWSAVESVEIQQVSTYAVYGLLKVASRKSLIIRLANGGLFGRRLGINPLVLDMGGRTVEGLALTLQAAQLGRSIPREAPAQPPTQAAWPEERAYAGPSEGERRAAPPPQPHPQSAFGAAPARATFGRRGV